MIAVCWNLLLSLSIFLLLVPIVTNAFRQNPKRGSFVSSIKYRYRQESTKALLLSPSKDSNQAIGIGNKNICLLVESDCEEANQFRDEAKRIANNLGISLLSTLENNNGNDSGEEPGSGEEFEITHALRLVPYECGGEEPLLTFALAIEPIESDASPQGKKKRRKPKKRSTPPFFVDLCPPPNSKAGRRASGSSGKADLLVKAVAPWKGRSNEGAAVWDLTAGLGQDSLILARNGAKTVTMVERHPVVAALLQDAMRRLELLELSPSSERNNQKELLKTLQFSFGEGREVLQKENPSDCDVVYLDPMFPPRQKQSAVKKGMSILHGLLETHVRPDSDETETSRQVEEQELLEAALAVAKLRVVVKRPAKAPLLGDGNTKPSHALTGSVNRWDVYVKPQLE